MLSVKASVSAQTLACVIEEGCVGVENSIDHWDEENYEITKERLKAARKDKRDSSLREEEEKMIVRAVAIEFMRSSNNSLRLDRAKGKIEIEYQNGTKALKRSMLSSIMPSRTLAVSKSLYESAETVDWGDCEHVRRPNLSKIAGQLKPNIWKNIVNSRRFKRYAYRFANAQVGRTLRHPTLPQPKGDQSDDTSEMVQTRPRHRFIIGADTQFGIMMDGFAMQDPNWDKEIEISRRAVKKINAMGKKPGEEHKRPLFICMCGDLVDTEASFCSAMASWKKVMNDWERHLVFEQQNRDFKEVWSNLDPDIPMVCLCGNHDVGNRPTRQSIDEFKKNYGDDYLAFWANGTYNIVLNNNLFADPTDAQDLFDEQLTWLEDRLIYAKDKNARQIFVYGHYPWFLNDENEEDSNIQTHSFPPEGWGAPGAKFADFYFTVPIEYRKIALDLFKKYDVKACFSGHFHQNVTTRTSWGMEMVVTGPLSMLLTSDSQRQFCQSTEEEQEKHDVGFRVVEVKDDSIKHKFLSLDCDDLL